MNKKKQGRFAMGVKGFFRSRLNTWIIVSSTVAVFGIYFVRLQDIHIFPSRNDFTFEFYTDNANGGNSKIVSHLVSDTIIDFSFDLKEGFLSPYVGICIRPKKDRVINLTHYNVFQIDIEGQGVKSIGFSLFHSNPFDGQVAKNKEIVFYTNLEISPQRKLYRVSLNQLKIPDWWNDANNISPSEKIKPDLKQILHINLGTTNTPSLGSTRSLRIHSITFRRNNHRLFLFLGMAELTMILFLVIIYYLQINFTGKAEPITIAYKPVAVENDNQQIKGFLDYINHNFHKNDLTLEHVSSHSGINQRRIANYIQQTFGCNFKTYVNQIRINESKRLLGESKLNMGEIAFKVGFNNQSHFNRVFKSLIGISPSEYRERKK